MKFGKRLRATVEDSYDDWAPEFMNYKQLKKSLNLPSSHPHPDRSARSAQSGDSASNHSDNPASQSSSPSQHDAHPHNPDSGPSPHLSAVQRAEHEHPQFFATFRREVDKVNDFFLDKQEDYIIQHARLSSSVTHFLQPAAATRPQVLRLRQRLTDFHGELVLMEQFSTVNYTGFRKILKKHDKKTGHNMRNIYLKTVLLTPFFLSDTVRKLVATTEAQLHALSKIRKFRRPVDTIAQHPVHPATSTPHPLQQDLDTPS